MKTREKKKSKLKEKKRLNLLRLVVFNVFNNK